MKLRHWQFECAQQALQHYQLSSHFLCLATPGAGKTIVAAEIARSMYQAQQVDFVLCFSPSKEIASSIRKTFSARMKAKFNGSLGAVGESFTFHKLRFLADDFWTLLENHRVLVVLDEIHHCAGDELENANAWGEEILLRILNKAAYTLALSGTPWRSDNLPIVLSKYTSADNQIICNYTYGLQQAIKDHVCCIPQIVLIDNDAIGVTKYNETHKVYSSFEDLINNTDLKYSDLINNDQVMRYALKTAHNKLSELRKDSPETAGLVVASSVEHAVELQKILIDEFGTTAIIVNYTLANTSELIEQFRNGSEEWIVSVGMISEGTDIKRLKVCCYLSDVKTELYFRQVLGRIIRVTQHEPQTAWLYVLNDFTLREYAQRINTDIPEYNIVLRDVPEPSFVDDHIENNENLLQESGRNTHDSGEDILTTQSVDTLVLLNNNSPTVHDTVSMNHLMVNGDYREKIINLFSMS
ncbi:DEAD/DEAH box helicase family protein [uncultured Tolumonas sp.]|uniref:DEAD/DEAH box helicase n=1 Tax=uncultured Tolumonas sp. TaxID=263765 RepID=UPI00292F0305|nr:DEAD/DEAH box helicase family protein [uncultured Tolumonas sp.]